MADLMDPTVISEMLRVTPGAVPVSFGGVHGWGHFANVPEPFGEAQGVIASSPAVVIPSGYFPDICLDDGKGEASGIGKPIRVGDYNWYVRDLEPGEAPGELRVLLSNRQT